MSEDIAVTSPTKETGDAKGKESNLTVGQAAAQLFAQAEKAEQKQAQTATEVKLPEQSEAPPETPVAETTQVSAEPPPPPPPPAETTQAPESPEEGDEAVHSQKSQFTPEQQEIFNKRLGKEVAKTKAIEAQMEATKARLAELEAKLSAAPTEPAAPAPVVVPAEQPLKHINDLQSLEKHQKAAEEAIDFVEKALDTPTLWRKIVVTDPATGEELLDRETGEKQTIKVTTIGKFQYTEADLRESARNAKADLRAVPLKEKFLKSREAYQQLAAVEFPFLYKKDAPEYQMAQAARRDPNNYRILERPDAEMIIGYQIIGRSVHEAQKAAKNAPPPPKPKAAAPKPSNDQTVVSTSTAAVRQPIGSADRQALEAERMRLSKKGGITAEDAVKFLQQSEALRKSR